MFILKIRVREVNKPIGTSHNDSGYKIRDEDSGNRC